jgi:hypothetical protein
MPNTHYTNPLELIKVYDASPQMTAFLIAQDETLYLVFDHLLSGPRQSIARDTPEARREWRTLLSEQWRAIEMPVH